MDLTLLNEARKTIDARVSEAIPAVYNSCRILNGKQGQWLVYERREFEVDTFLEKDRKVLPDGFCALYKAKDIQTGLCIGSLEDITLMESTATKLSEFVFEPRSYLSLVTRNLTTDGGAVYLATKGVQFSIITLLVSFPYEFAQLTQNPQIAGPLILGGTFWTLLCACAGDYLGERLGRLMDERRLRQLPQNAFVFGSQAEESILSEYRVTKEEERKKRVHQKLIENGIVISRDAFAEAYGNENKWDMERVIALMDYLRERGKPVRTRILMGAFS